MKDIIGLFDGNAQARAGGKSEDAFLQLMASDSVEGERLQGDTPYDGSDAYMEARIEEALERGVDPADFVETPNDQFVAVTFESTPVLYLTSRGWEEAQGEMGDQYEQLLSRTGKEALLPLRDHLEEAFAAREKSGFSRDGKFARFCNLGGPGMPRIFAEYMLKDTRNF